MTSRRVVAVVTVGLLAVAANPTHAAVRRSKPKPKPVCNLLKDNADDTRAPVPGLESFYPQPALDIVSADMASDARNLTMVVRVKDLEQVPDPKAPEGSRWQFGFNIGLVALDYEVSTGPFVSSSDKLQPPEGGTAVADPVKNEVRMTMPLSVIAQRGVSVKRGTKVTNLRAYTTHFAAFDKRSGTSYGLNVYGVDSGSSTTAYSLGHPSCVKVGK